jgi:hypothetical protein
MWARAPTLAAVHHQSLVRFDRCEGCGAKKCGAARNFSRPSENRQISDSDLDLRAGDSFVLLAGTNVQGQPSAPLEILLMAEYIAPACSENDFELEKLCLVIHFTEC